MICNDVCPFKAILGEEIGMMMLHEHTSHGVNVHTKSNVTKVNADSEGNVKSVILTDGKEVECDLLIVGTGVRPATSFLKDSGLEMDERGGIVCDPFLNTNDKNIFAAGDIASYPYWPTGARLRSEHWVTALDQGSYAAFNMLGKMSPYGSIPFFWTRHYDKSLQYVGNGQGWSEVHITGDVKSNKFVAYYINAKDQVVAVAAQANASAALTMMEALGQNKMPSGSDIKSGKETPATVQAKLKQNTDGGRCKRANCCQKKAVVDTPKL